MKLKIDREKLPKIRLPRWLEFRILLALLLLGLLVAAMSISEPVPQMGGAAAASARFSSLSLKAEATAAPVQTGTVDSTRPATPVPAEWYTNRSMANGIVLGAVALVLIIVGGTLSVIRKKTN